MSRDSFDPKMDEDPYECYYGSFHKLLPLELPLSIWEPTGTSFPPCKRKVELPEKFLTVGPIWRCGTAQLSQVAFIPNCDGDGDGTRYYRYINGDTDYYFETCHPITPAYPIATSGLGYIREHKTHFAQIRGELLLLDLMRVMWTSPNDTSPPTTFAKLHKRHLDKQPLSMETIFDPDEEKGEEVEEVEEGDEMEERM